MNECPRAEGKEFFRLLNKFDGHQFIGLQEEAEILVLVQTDKKQFGTDRLHRRLLKMCLKCWNCPEIFSTLSVVGALQPPPTTTTRLKPQPYIYCPPQSIVSTALGLFPHTHRYISKVCQLFQSCPSANRVFQVHKTTTSGHSQNICPLSGKNLLSVQSPSSVHLFIYSHDTDTGHKSMPRDTAQQFASLDGNTEWSEMSWQCQVVVVVVSNEPKLGWNSHTDYYSG